MVEMLMCTLKMVGLYEMSWLVRNVMVSTQCHGQYEMSLIAGVG